MVALGATPDSRDRGEVVASSADPRDVRTLLCRVDVPDEARIPLRPRMIRVVLENLVTNAIRYAGPGARCRVSAERREGAVVLTVADDGQGVADEDLPACSSASTAPIGRAPRAEPGSGSRSSSTSSPRRAARSRPPARRGRAAPCARASRKRVHHPFTSGRSRGDAPRSETPEAAVLRAVHGGREQHRRDHPAPRRAARAVPRGQPRADRQDQGARARRRPVDDRAGRARQPDVRDAVRP